jgi:hypothetical protein
MGHYVEEIIGSAYPGVGIVIPTAFCWLTSAFVINSASVPCAQLVSFPAKQSLDNVCNFKINLEN